jgi:hypothetical protein
VPAGPSSCASSTDENEIVMHPRVLLQALRSANASVRPNWTANVTAILLRRSSLPARTNKRAMKAATAPHHRVSSIRDRDVQQVLPTSSSCSVTPAPQGDRNLGCRRGRRVWQRRNLPARERLQASAQVAYACPHFLRWSVLDDGDE